MAFQSIRLTGTGGRTSYLTGIAFTFSAKGRYFNVRIAENVCEKCDFLGRVKLDIQHDPESGRFRIHRDPNGVTFGPQKAPPAKKEIIPVVRRGRPLKMSAEPAQPPPEQVIEPAPTKPKYMRINGSVRLDLKVMEKVFGGIMETGKILHCHAVQIEPAAGVVDFTLAPGKHSIV